MISKVIIAGGTHLGGILASILNTADIRVSIVESNPILAERVGSVLGTSSLIIQGSSTNVSVLEEAGVEHCDAFIAAKADDEINILSCLLAKKHGASLGIAVTSNQDYLKILSGMTMIDCCFSPIISAVNRIIKHVGTENRQTVAVLKRTSAEVVEMKVTTDSPIAYQRIKEINFPVRMVFALIIRDHKIIPAIGDQKILPNDLVIVFTDPKSIPMVDKLFTKKGIFS